MVVYGVALLAFCMLTGIFLGDLLGQLIGVDANVGGIGIAMLLLIFIANVRTNRFEIKTLTKSGVNFWSAMYIPIVVAMAAKQNVLAAISGGWMAIIAGVMTVIISFLMIFWSNLRFISALSDNPIIASIRFEAIIDIRTASIKYCCIKKNIKTVFMIWANNSKNPSNKKWSNTCKYLWVKCLNWYEKTRKNRYGK